MATGGLMAGRNGKRPLGRVPSALEGAAAALWPISARGDFSSCLLRY